MQREKVGVVLLQFQREQRAELSDRIGRGFRGAGGHRECAGLAVGGEFLDAGLQFLDPALELDDETLEFVGTEICLLVGKDGAIVAARLGALALGTAEAVLRRHEIAAQTGDVGFELLERGGKIESRLPAVTAFLIAGDIRGAFLAIIAFSCLLVLPRMAMSTARDLVLRIAGAITAPAA